MFYDALSGATFWGGGINLKVIVEVHFELNFVWSFSLRFLHPDFIKSFMLYKMACCLALFGVEF